MTPTERDREQGRAITAAAIGGGNMYSNAEIAVRLSDAIAAALAAREREVRAATWKDAEQVLQASKWEGVGNSYCAFLIEQLREAARNEGRDDGKV